MKLKEMAYTNLEQEELLAKGNYNGCDYFVLNYGSHPCGYVNVKGTSLEGKNYWDIYNLIDVHGGVNYSRPDLHAFANGGWFIGWSYDHFRDYHRGLASLGIVDGYRKWSTDEIIAECESVIDQVRDLEKKVKKEKDSIVKEQ